jgi:hypothetical protein
MNKFALLGAAAVLSTMSISALHAQAVGRESGACPGPSAASGETRAPAPTADWLPARVRKIDLAMVGARRSSAATINRCDTGQVFVRPG